MLGSTYSLNLPNITPRTRTVKVSITPQSAATPLIILYLSVNNEVNKIPAGIINI